MKTGKWGVIGALFLTACSGGDPVDIGNDEVTGEKLEDYVASWDGHAEGVTFADGSDRVRLQLFADGSGTLLFGEGTPVSVASGDLPPTEDEVGTTSFDGAMLLQVEYPATGTVSVGRLQLSVNPTEMYRPFCESIDSVPEGTPPLINYDCDLSDYVDPGSGCFSEVEVDCRALKGCASCVCDADGCAIDEGRTIESFLDAALDEDGSSLVGTLQISEAVTVRLERVD